MSEQSASGTPFEQVLSRIAEREADYIDLCSRIVQIPSENPPGDTTELADYLSGFLTAQGVEHQVLLPRPGNPIIVASTGRELGDGPHVILNGHLDVFPADDAALWSRPPFSGEVADGRLHGRGAADMKAGTTASLVTFLLLHEIRDQLQGRVSLTLVSDEETGGAWGAVWLLDNYPEYVGDALLNAEPTGPGTIWIGEKGISWLRVIAEGPAGHGSTGRGVNTITRLMEATLVARTVADIEGEAPHDVQPLLEAQALKPIFDSEEVVGNLMTHCSVNVGVITGGIKANVVPRYAEAEVDIRVPLGVTPDQVRQEVISRIEKAGITGVRVEPIMHQTIPASVLSPNTPLVAQMQRHAQTYTGVTPALELCPGATDARFWRTRGVPTVIYGPTSHGMAEPDEYIEIAEYLNVIKVHTATALELLGITAG